MRAFAVLWPGASSSPSIQRNPGSQGPVLCSLPLKHLPEAQSPHMAAPGELGSLSPQMLRVHPVGKMGCPLSALNMASWGRDLSGRPRQRVEELAPGHMVHRWWGWDSNRPPQTPAPGEERSRQHRPVGQWYVLYLFLTPTPWPTLAGLRAHPLLVFPQNKAASTRHAKVEASIRAGERELHLCLLLLKEGVWGVDLPLNGETGRLGWGWGVRAPG